MHVNEENEQLHQDIEILVARNKEEAEEKKKANQAAGKALAVHAPSTTMVLLLSIICGIAFELFTYTLC
jgi:hypothetical protein